MAEELEPESLPLVRALDDPRDVRDDECPGVTELDDTEVRLEGRERVISDLRASSRDHREEGGLPRIGLADQPDVGDELELELDIPDLSLLARLPFARRLMRGGGEMRIPLPAPSALRDPDLVAMLEHFRDPLAGVAVPDHGPRRHGQDDIAARAAGLVRAHPMFAALGFPMIAIREVEEGGEVGVPAHEHVAPLAALPTVGAAHGCELLTAERGAAGAAGAGGDANGDEIDEHGERQMGDGRWER